MMASCNRWSAALLVHDSSVSSDRAVQELDAVAVMKPECESSTPPGPGVHKIRIYFPVVLILRTVPRTNLETNGAVLRALNQKGQGLRWSCFRLLRNILRRLLHV